MSECAFDLILEEWAESEWEEYADAPEFKTSKKHECAMKRIFKLYDKNTRHLHLHSETRIITIRRRITVALLLIILAVITGFTAAYFISQGFRGEVHSDNTELLPIIMENCPTVIEDKYYLSELPEGFEIISTRSDPFSMTTIYKNNQTGQTISFHQSVKENYSVHYNTEKGELVEVEVNGHNGVFLEIIIDNKSLTGITWDNGDYILEISSTLSKSSLINLAESAKVL